ncbi:MAG TPA: hypothetical protein VEF76_02160 [Patescibacteria group bacterium]|nr:hypothetical protein [Patescibacteria group bacterium]
MKYAIPLLFALALAAPLNARAAKLDMSCVKGDCKKTDPAAAAAAEMNKAAGIPIEAPVATPEETDRRPAPAAAAEMPPPAPNLGDMPPDSAISEIARAVEHDNSVRMSGPGTAGAETCGGFKAEQEAQRTHPYTGELQRGWLENRAKIVAYGAELRESQLAVRQKMIAYGDELKAAQASQIAAHVSYHEQLVQEQLAVRAKSVAYGEELQIRQQLMRCPPAEMYGRDFRK